MSNWKFLDVYLSSISASQKQHLLNTLYSDVNSGILSSQAEYQNRLSSELNQLEGNNANSTFSQYKADYQGKTNSANYNAMEVSAISNLQTLYVETVLLSNTISDQNVITQVSLDGIESAIDRMSKQLDNLELLASNTDGYVDSAYESFSENDTNRLQRSDTTNLAPFFYNPYGTLDSQYDAEIENNKLKLPIANTIDYKLESLNLYNPEPSTTLASDQFSMANLLDESNDSFWAQSVYVTSLPTEPKATVYVVINLLGMQALTRLVLNPFSKFPYKVTGIYYNQRKTDTIDLSNVIDLSDSLDISLPVLIEDTTTFEFSPISAEQLIIGIEQSNYSHLRYVMDTTTDTVSKIYDVANGTETDISSITDSVDSMAFAMSSNLKNELDITASGTPSIVDTYEFLYGLKSLSVSQLQYRPIGIFVSQNHEIDNLGVIGLETDESTVADRCSIEYDVFVNYTTNGTTEYLTQSILPNDISTIQSEVLDGISNASNNWEATTRFPVSGIPTVYMNNIELSSDSYSIIDANGYKKIIILPSIIAWPTLRASTFTIEYTPTEDAYTVSFPTGTTNAIINLRILLRSTNPNKQVTPIVESFSLKFKKYASQ
jgi:hypothetical protein